MLFSAEIEKNYTERYRSGHNGADSKSYTLLVVSSPQNPYRIGVFVGSNNLIFCCSTLKFYPKDFPLKISFGVENQVDIHGEVSKWS